MSVSVKTIFFFFRRGFQRENPASGSLMSGHLVASCQGIELIADRWSLLCFGVSLVVQLDNKDRVVCGDCL